MHSDITLSTRLGDSSTFAAKTSAIELIYGHAHSFNVGRKDRVKERQKAKHESRGLIPK
jgi:hypothetical protein